MDLPILRNRLRCGAVLVTAISLSVAACGGSHGQNNTTTRSSPVPPTAQPAATLEEQFVAIVKQVQPEVVQIQTGTGLGSGVVFDRRGDIVTNAHVLAGTTDVTVTLADGRRFPGRVIGSYVPDDLAVVSIGSGRRVSPAQFADSSKAAVGDLVLAAGNPLGLQSSVTDGIISALGRNVSEGQGVVIPNAIQTSAAINPGNSGGALVDLDGRVIGIPTLAAANPQLGTAAAGIGFAIPSNTVTDIAGQIVRHGRVVNSHRAALGASLADSTAGPGALIVALQEGGPAAKAGLAVGDVINKIDNKQVNDVSAFAAALASYRPGDRVSVSATTLDGATRTATVRLGQLPGT